MADSRTKRYDVKYHLMLDQTHRAMLDQLAEKENVPASQIVRRWISQAFRMDFEAEPRCISGMSCLCPRAHINDAAPRVSDAELLQRHTRPNGETESQKVP